MIVLNLKIKSVLGMMVVGNLKTISQLQYIACKRPKSRKGKTQRNKEGEVFKRKGGRK